MNGDDTLSRELTWTPKNSKRFTLLMKNTDGDAALTVAGASDGVNGSGVRARAVLSAKLGGGIFTCEFYTDSGTEPFTLTAPAASEYKLVYRGYLLRLYADGKLADEEWPFGGITEGTLSATFEGFADVQFIDGAEDTSAPKREALPDNMQYFSPAGANAGDCIPFFHDGVFHLYYLYDRRHHRSKRGLGAHQWAHVSTRDFKSWDNHPLALAITDESEGSLCTGSIIEKDGKFYAFYARRDAAGGEEILTYGVGDTPDSFVKTNEPLFYLPAPPYVKGPCRDPFVYAGEDGLYHMLVTARQEDGFTGNKGGCLARLASADLLNWTEEAPYFPGYSDDPECPDMFFWNGWYYLIFSNEGVAKYRMTKNPGGQWSAPSIDTLEAPCCRVMKTAEFHGGRRIGAAFLETEFGFFGGNIIFRELLQNGDGTLAVRQVPELAPKVKRTVYTENVTGISSPEGFTAVRLPDMPNNFRLSAEVRAAGRFVSIGVRGRETFADGYELQFDLSRRTAQVRPASHGYFRDNNKHTVQCGQLESFKLSLIVSGDILDAEIGGRTICVRIGGGSGGLTHLCAHSAEASFYNIRAEAI